MRGIEWEVNGSMGRKLEKGGVIWGSERREKIRKKLVNRAEKNVEIWERG